MDTVERMPWLASTPDELDFYTDHNILLFIFHPLPLVPDLSQSSLCKVMRRAVCIWVSNYQCIHITGEGDVWVNFLSHWTPSITARSIISISALPSASDSDFEWTSSIYIVAVQNYVDYCPSNHQKYDSLWLTSSDFIWIPIIAIMFWI